MNEDFYRRELLRVCDDVIRLSYLVMALAACCAALSVTTLILFIGARS